MCSDLNVKHPDDQLLRQCANLITWTNYSKKLLSFSSHLLAAIVVIFKHVAVMQNTKTVIKEPHPPLVKGNTQIPLNTLYFMSFLHSAPIITFPQYFSCVSLCDNVSIDLLLRL